MLLRHLSEDSAFETLEKHCHLKHGLTGGADSSEVGNPPQKFANVFGAARELGFRVVAHAGKKGPVSYIWDALDILKQKIDHGVLCR